VIKTSTRDALAVALRSDDEAIPQTPFALIAVPAPMVVILLGVAAARIVDRGR